MSKKRLSKEDQIIEVEQKLSAREARKAAWEALNKQEEIPVSKQAFLDFWAENRRRFGKDREFAEIVWLHLIASGMATPDKFEAGLKHFGLKG